MSAMLYAHVLSSVSLLVLISLLVLCCLFSTAALAQSPPLRVGSKKFTESVVLGEIIAQLARSTGAPAEHLQEMGGTRILWNALIEGEIDVYPEYTGTIAQEILSGEKVDDVEAMRRALAKRDILVSAPLGFNNTYAIGMREEVAARLGIEKISDLRAHPELRFGFSNEFMDRGDGWPGLKARYGLPHENAKGLDHDLAYRALEGNSLDAMDLYSTDAEIRYYGLRVLADDLGYFPEYKVLLLYRADLGTRFSAALAALQRLQGQISAAEMVAMNARAKLDKVPSGQVAADFLRAKFNAAVHYEEKTLVTRLLERTGEHMVLVGLSLVAAILLAVPLGIASARYPNLGQLVLGAVGIIQTIPALALLVLMIPLLGIGAPAAIAALFLYSLLPIVRNTHAGLRDIPLHMRESAEALGLPAGARLRQIELPLAARSILAGIKTSAVINVGFATLGALIAAGGYGQPILTGIRLDDTGLILEGALPAALLALVVQGVFELVERFLVPKGLRIEPEGEAL
jgi:osmoprotectant transport system permease protein